MASYTVVIVPLRNRLTSLDAVHFFLWVKKLKDLEREKDLLWMGLHALEQVRERLCSKLEDNSSKKEMRKVLQEFPDTPTLLLAQIHRVNMALRNLLCNSRNPTNPAQGRPSIEGTEGHLPSPAYSEESACF